MPKDLRYFIEYLDNNAPAEIVRVKRPVDPKHEISSIVRKLQSENRFPVVLCEQVKGSKMPVITNIYASRQRFAHILEVPADELLQRCFKATTTPIQPKIVKQGPIQDVVMTGEEVDLRKIPIVTHAEKDAGPFITVGVTIVKDPETGIRNAGIYRMMYKGKNRMTIEPSVASNLYYIFKKAENLGQPLEAVTFIGGHPALGVGSQAMGDEIGVMGSLLGKPVDLLKCLTVDLEVPAYADIAIEGRMPPGEREFDGPFGEYTFLMGPGLEVPRFEVTAITHRNDAIYHDIHSPYADHLNPWLFMSEADLYRRVKESIPQTSQVRMPFFGVSHVALVQLKTAHLVTDGQAKQAGLAALATHAWLRIAILIDDDINIDDMNEVLYAIATRTRPDRDVNLIYDVACSPLDPMAYTLRGRREPGKESQIALNTKMIIDATKTIDIPFPERCDPPKEMWERINLAEYLKE